MASRLAVRLYGGLCREPFAHSGYNNFEMLPRVLDRFPPRGEHPGGPFELHFLFAGPLIHGAGIGGRQPRLKARPDLSLQCRGGVPSADVSRPDDLGRLDVQDNQPVEVIGNDEPWPCWVSCGERRTGQLEGRGSPGPIGVMATRPFITMGVTENIADSLARKPTLLTARTCGISATRRCSSRSQRDAFQSPAAWATARNRPE